MYGFRFVNVGISIGIEDWMNVWEMKPVVLLELELNVMIVIEIVLVWCLLWIEVY